MIMARIMVPGSREVDEQLKQQGAA
jgi:hypothetical protein